MFREKYTYSKLVDDIILKKEQKEIEEIEKCNNYICNKNKYECCVCFDEMSRFCKTPCDHYICRMCINKLKPKKCPMCRKCYCGQCAEC